MPKSKAQAKTKEAKCCPLCGNTNLGDLDVQVISSPHAILIFCHSCNEILLVQKVTKLPSKSNFAS
jgi:hypothetical protein